MKVTKKINREVPKKWADEALLLAVNLGVIVSAEYGNFFHPNTCISRLEMAKMISRALAIYDDCYRLVITFCMINYSKRLFTETHL